jgi:DNA invertase Pin-like site-specific DNA recombinase
MNLLWAGAMQNHFSAIIYGRFSDPSQSRGSSEERQVELGTALCAEKGWTVEAVITDRGKSGFKGRHREPGAALFEFEAEAADLIHVGKVLVVEKLDRLSRLGPQRTLRLITDLLDRGVNIATCDGKFYHAYQEPPIVEILTILIEANADRKVSENTAERVKAAHERRLRKVREKGVAKSANLPSWLRVGADGKPEAIPARAASLLHIFERADGGTGSQVLEREFNKKGLQPWDHRAKRWHRTTISKLLCNRAVLGEYHVHAMNEAGQRVPTGEVLEIYPQVIPADLFKRVNDMAQQRKAVRGRRSPAIVNIVSGLVRCDHCGEKMGHMTHRKAGLWVRRNRKATTLTRDSASLVCRAKHAGVRCENRGYLNYPRFEDALLDEVLPLALDNNFYRQRGEVGQVKTELAEAERRLRLVKDEAKAMWRGWQKTQSDTAMELAQEADAKVKAGQAAITQLEARLKIAEGRVSASEHLERVKATRALLSDPNETVRGPARAQVAAALANIIDMISIDKEGRALVIYSGGFGGCEIVKGKVLKGATLTDAIMGGVVSIKALENRGASYATVNSMMRRDLAQRSKTVSA